MRKKAYDPIITKDSHDGFVTVVDRDSGRSWSYVIFPDKIPEWNTLKRKYKYKPKTLVNKLEEIAILEEYWKERHKLLDEQISEEEVDIYIDWLKGKASKMKIRAKNVLAKMRKVSVKIPGDKLKEMQEDYKVMLEDDDTEDIIDRLISNMSEEAIAKDLAKLGIDDIAEEDIISGYKEVLEDDDKEDLIDRIILNISDEAFVEDLAELLGLSNLSPEEFISAWPNLPEPAENDDDLWEFEK